jgi:hypothetical protein
MGIQKFSFWWARKERRLSIFWFWAYCCDERPIHTRQKSSFPISQWFLFLEPYWTMGLGNLGMQLLNRCKTIERTSTGFVCFTILKLFQNGVTIFREIIEPIFVQLLGRPNVSYSWRIAEFKTWVESSFHRNSIPATSWSEDSETISFQCFSTTLSWLTWALHFDQKYFLALKIDLRSPTPYFLKKNRIWQGQSCIALTSDSHISDQIGYQTWTEASQWRSRPNSIILANWSPSFHSLFFMDTSSSRTHLICHKL